MCINNSNVFFLKKKLLKRTERNEGKSEGMARKKFSSL